MFRKEDFVTYIWLGAAEIVCSGKKLSSLMQVWLRFVK